MTNRLRAFTSPSAFPNPQRLRLFMFEKGIEGEVEEIIYDMTPGGEQRKWKHLKMNPWGETPTLELNHGSYLAEMSAIVRYLDLLYPGRKIMGESALEQGQDAMWNDRIWVHILYRIVTMFHVMHQGLGFKLELTYTRNGANTAVKKEALSHAALVDRHLSDGSDWLLSGDAPTFADITLCTAITFSKYPTNNTPLDEPFEYIERIWQRWQERDSFQKAYADRRSGLVELDYLKNA